MGIDIKHVKVEQHGLISLTYHNEEQMCIVGDAGTVCKENDNSEGSM